MRKKIKCQICKDQRVILVQRPNVPGGDYYELCKCQTNEQQNKRRVGRTTVSKSVR